GVTSECDPAPSSVADSREVSDAVEPHSPRRNRSRITRVRELGHCPPVPRLLEMNWLAFVAPGVAGAFPGGYHAGSCPFPADCTVCRSNGFVGLGCEKLTVTISQKEPTIASRF